MENEISIGENLPRMAVVVMSSGSDGWTLEMRGEVSRGWLCQDWVFDGGTLPIADPLWFPRMHYHQCRCLWEIRGLGCSLFGRSMS